MPNKNLLKCLTLHSDHEPVQIFKGCMGKNVCGLMSKLKDPDFLNIYQNYDILFFQETDNLDDLSLPDGFTYVAKHRKKCLRKSGGIVTI